jgi:predicted lipoprotein
MLIKRIGLILVGLAILSSLFWCFPLFHFVPLQQAAAQKAQAEFNAAQFTADFWQQRLLKSLDQAVKAETLVELLKSDPIAARKQFSRTLGLGDSHTYFISGTGRVISVSDQEISLTITAGASKPQVAIQVGLLFGNTVRDATGLLNVNDYPNSQDFNAISQELNRIIETRVLPDLKAKAKVGATIRFVGCAQVDDPATDLNPLRVIPVRAEVE